MIVQPLEKKDNLDLKEKIRRGKGNRENEKICIITGEKGLKNAYKHLYDIQNKEIHIIFFNRKI